MDVVVNRNLVWNRAKPIMELMYALTCLLSVKTAQKRLEKKRFKVGWINMAWRYVLLRRIGTVFQGNGYRIIQSNVCIYNAQNLVMGECVTLNDNSYVECAGGIEIGSNVMIGHGVSILSNSHKFDTTEITMNMQGEKFGEIKIGNDVWIGAKATVLMGVTIGEGAVIGAHALVNRNVEPYEVVAGVPARHIRYRMQLENMGEQELI